MNEKIYAGFWIRTVAAIIDSVLFLIIIVPILTAIYGTNYWASEAFFKGYWDLFFNYILPAIAVIIFWSYKSATPGKMALKLSIVDSKTGEKPSTGQFVGRYFGYYVSMLPLFLGIIWVGFDKRKQGWHDKLAGTVVVKDKLAAGRSAQTQLTNNGTGMKSKWLKYVLIVVVGLPAAAIALLLIYDAFQPEYTKRPISHTELTSENIKFLEMNGLLENHERIFLFFSLTDIEKEGVFFSDIKATIYDIPKEKKPIVQNAPYEEIKNIEHIRPENMITSYPKIIIQLKNGAICKFEIHGGEDIDRVFYESLKSEWHRRNKS